MPTEVQIIDGFERLRESFIGSNPGALVQHSPPANDHPVRHVIEAWLQAMDGKAADTPPERRRLRTLSRAILSEEDPADGLSRPDLDLLTSGRPIPKLLPEAARLGLAPIAAAPRPMSLAEQAEAWRRILPGLTPLRAWRFLGRLGQPALTPHIAIKRFFWRLGLIEQAPTDAIDPAELQSVAEKIADVSGLDPHLVNRLINWHTNGEPALRDGRLCGPKPRCAACPLKSVCAWARFHPAAADKENPAQERHLSLEPLYHQIAADNLANLKEIELLAILLHGGTGGQGALDLAESLLRKFVNLRGIDQASVTELTQLRGISRGRAAQIKASLELGRRFASHGLAAGDPISCSSDIWQAYRARFHNLCQEHFVVILLDTKNRVMHDTIVSKGSLTGSQAHPREVFKLAVRHAASAIILLHNHPSGDPFPSPQDREVTARLRESGEILGIRVLDHIILGAEDYYSFTDDA